MVEPGTGEVKALAQSRPMGRNRKKGETFLNYAVPKKYGDSNGFQAGSTFKVFVLAAAIEQGIPLNEVQRPARCHPAERLRHCPGTLPASATGTCTTRPPAARRTSTPAPGSR